MSEETRKVVLWRDRENRGTDKAYRFLTFPRGDAMQRVVWVPRSVVTHVSADPVVGDAQQRCTVEVMEWFADKEEL